MKRVLHFGLTNNIGGVETFVMNIYRHIDRSLLQFDFLTQYNFSVAFKDEIISMGGNIYSEIYPKSESLRKHASSYKNFFEICGEGCYNAVHMHSNFPRYYAPLKYAKRYGVPIRIYHSHNSMDMYPSKSAITNVKKRILENMTGNALDKYATNLFACSETAGKYMFGDKPFKVIPNAIETDKYIFNEDIRKRKREELGLGDKFVVGTVGRLQYQKNPEFIIDVFCEIYKKNKNSELIMVGAGPLEDKIRKLIHEYGLENSVLMLGQRFDVPELLQAFDCFLLPSRFEGLAIVYIEAQAAGLPCFVSSAVPEEAEISSLMKIIPLDTPPQEWAAEILNQNNIPRRNMKSEIISAGFDIEDLAKRMTEFYLGGNNG